MRKILFILFLSIVLTGCGESKNVTIKGQEGETLTFGAKELPKNFPADIPIYKGAKPSGSYVTSGTGEGLIVTFSSNAEFNTVSDYYKTELSKNGWEVNNTQNATETMVYLIKKSERVGTVSITKKENTTEIAIILGKGEE